MNRIQELAAPSMVIAVTTLVLIVCASASASDHGDGHIGDFYAFTNSGNLVLAMTVAAELPHHVEDYKFSSDFTFGFHIDNHSKVAFDNDLENYGGTVLEPDEISEDVEFRVSFPNGGNVACLGTSGMTMGSGTSSTLPLLHVGVCDEPFIRRTVAGNNIPAIILQVPLHNVCVDSDVSGSQHLLLWATITARDENGREFQHDLCGRPYRSQGPDGRQLNSLHPSLHMSELGMAPDVLILDPTRPTAFPNGRWLEDDVVNILGLQNTLPGEQPSPATNDVMFLDRFPFLAPAHDTHRDQFISSAPRQNVRMDNQELGRFDLGRELPGMGGRDVRLRYWLMPPGATIQFHQHRERPAMVYLLTGKVEEYKWGERGKSFLKAGDMTREAADTEHFWFNTGKESVRMAAVDLVDSYQEPAPAPSTRPLPQAAYDISKSAAAAQTSSTSGEFKVLDTIALRDTVPHIPLAYHYQMRGREIILNPGEFVPLQRHAGRPGITYVIDGDVKEYRDDRAGTAVLKAGDFTFNTGGVNRWLENTTEAKVRLFEVDFRDTVVTPD